jgi:hypothetical protein
MELVWKQLLNTMEAMTERCQAMLVLAQRQREAVVQENIGSVGEIVIEQEYAQTDFQNLEQERLALVKDLSAQLGLGDKPVTATSLLSYVPPTWSNAYRLQVEMLKKAMAEVKQEHEVNRKLIRHSQQFVSWVLQFLVTPEGASALYSDMGEKVQRSYYHVVNQAL